MRNSICRVGDTHGVLFIKTPAAKVANRQAWVCVCTVCKEESVITTRTILSAIDKGCRCASRKHLIAKNKVDKPTLTHGMRYTPIYDAWRAMKKRCSLSSSEDYKNYGGRGIKVCQRWKDSFESFLEDMGPRPGDLYSLDRIDVNGDYVPINCRWATQDVQFNNKRDSKYIVFEGETKTITQFAKQFGLPPATVHGRVNRGWGVEKALTTPINKKEEE